MTSSERTLADDRHGRVALAAKYAALYLPHAQPALSFALHGGGFRRTRLLAIHEVTNADLPLGLDPSELLDARMRALGENEGGVGMLTSRRVAALELAHNERDGVFARALVTCGLSNAVRVGDPPGPLEAWGTINIVVQLSAALHELALIEALSIVAEARTLAVYEAGVPSRRSGSTATGSGTDCIAVVAANAEPGERYAGKHTRVGYLIGDVTQRALGRALERWKTEYFG